MRLAQIRNGGGIVAAIREGGGFRPIPGYTAASLLAEADARGTSLRDLAAVRAGEDVVRAEAVIPVQPVEVWACGCTYAPSAEFRDGELGTSDGMYSYVYRPENRPEIFFKGTSRVCVGPNEAIGIRMDSTFTAPEPELGIVIGSRCEILGYTLGNDVSAWDIERENALYLPQSKVYTACCSLGPVLVTPDEIPDPYSLEMTCTIVRDGKETFSGSVSTGKLIRKFEELVDCVARSNTLPTPTVILTGTGIIVEQGAALRAGDVCSISVPEIGTLSNPARLV